MFCGAKSVVGCAFSTDDLLACVAADSARLFLFRAHWRSTVACVSPSLIEKSFVFSCQKIPLTGSSHHHAVNRRNRSSYRSPASNPRYSHDLQTPCFHSQPDCTLDLNHSRSLFTVEIEMPRQGRKKVKTWHRQRAAGGGVASFCRSILKQRTPPFQSGNYTTTRF